MSGAFDRRSVLLGSAGLVGVATLADCTREGSGTTADAGPSEDARDDGRTDMKKEDIVPILAAIADRLLPTDDLGPGVKEAGPEMFFEKVLADPRMKAIKSLVTRGAVWMHKAAKKEHNVGFLQLTPAQQDDLVGRMVEKKVRPTGFTPDAFIKVMLALTLEAFLGDPRHGGNRDQVGWKWVGGIDWSGRKLPVLK